MSGDLLDDLHAAENEISRLRGVLVDVHDALGILDKNRACCTDRWCRPSCAFLESGDCQDDDPSVCGCPCGHEAPSC